MQTFNKMTIFVHGSRKPLSEVLAKCAAYVGNLTHNQSDPFAASRYFANVKNEIVNMGTLSREMNEELQGLIPKVYVKAKAS